MFVVCGKDSENGLRVLDTDDNTVEYVTVEQLKVVQLSGCSVKFDNDMDYIYTLYKYNSRLSGIKIVKLLSKMVNTPISSSHSYFVLDAKLENMIFYLLFCNERVILIAIHSEGDKSFKMYMNSDIRDKMGNEDELGSARLAIRGKSRVLVRYNLRGRLSQTLVFDTKCNFRRCDGGKR